MLMILNSGYLMETSAAAYRISNYPLPGNLNWWLMGYRSPSREGEGMNLLSHRIDKDC